MEIILGVAGWIAWLLSAYLGLTWVYGCRTYARAGRSFHWATVMQAFFFSATAVVFLIGPLSKLHLIWVLPALFTSQLLAVSHIPFVGGLLRFLTGVFMRLALVGVRPPAIGSNNPEM